MSSSKLKFNQSRRDFLKIAFASAPFFHLKYRDLLVPSQMEEIKYQTPNIVYRYKTMSVDHFKKLQHDIDTLRKKNKLSRNKTYRGYIDKLKFEIPENFQKAKSIIILSVFTKLMYVNFHLDGKKHEVMMPPQYYDDGISENDLKNIVQKEIIKESGFRVENATAVHLKMLAARSGLAKYGINNLCFVDGMGSFITLYAFYTDYQFKEDNWQKITFMDTCRTCPICYGICPTNCIKKENFVIDVGHCITLYNEIKGNFPRWILPSMHNALMGCMKCQKHCPENEEYIKLAGRMEDITEEETRKILLGKPDDVLLRSLSDKLRNFPPASSKEYFPIFKRNLSPLLRRS